MFLFTGPIGIVAGISLCVGAWRNLKAYRTKPHSDTDRTKPAALMLVGLSALFIGTVHIVALLGNIAVKMSLQFDPEDVVQIDVYQVRHDQWDWQPDTPIVTVSDPDQIRQGLGTLSGATPYHSNHEHVIRGHVLRLQMRPEEHRPDLFLAVHHNTSRRKKANVVIIQETPTGRHSFSSGIYHSDAFVRWLNSQMAEPH